MYCGKCGQQQEPEARFCKNCGVELPRQAVDEQKTEQLPVQQPEQTTEKALEQLSPLEKTTQSNEKKKGFWNKFGVTAIVIAVVIFSVGVYNFGELIHPRTPYLKVVKDSDSPSNYVFDMPLKTAKICIEKNLQDCGYTFIAGSWREIYSEEPAYAPPEHMAYSVLSFTMPGSSMQCEALIAYMDQSKMCQMFTVKARVLDGEYASQKDMQQRSIDTFAIIYEGLTCNNGDNYLGAMEVLKRSKSPETSGDGFYLESRTQLEGVRYVNGLFYHPYDYAIGSLASPLTLMRYDLMMWAAVAVEPN